MFAKHYKAFQESGELFFRVILEFAPRGATSSRPTRVTRKLRGVSRICAVHCQNGSECAMFRLEDLVADPG